MINIFTYILTYNIYYEVTMTNIFIILTIDGETVEETQSGMLIDLLKAVTWLVRYKISTLWSVLRSSGSPKGRALSMILVVSTGKYKILFWTSNNCLNVKNRTESLNNYSKQ